LTWERVYREIDAIKALQRMHVDIKITKVRFRIQGEEGWNLPTAVFLETLDIKSIPLV